MQFANFAATYCILFFQLSSGDKAPDAPRLRIDWKCSFKEKNRDWIRMWDMQHDVIDVSPAQIMKVHI